VDRDRTAALDDGADEEASVPVFRMALGSGRPLAVAAMPLVALELGRTELRSGAAPEALDAADAGRATSGRAVAGAPEIDRRGAGEEGTEVVPEVPVLRREAAVELAAGGAPAGLAARTEAARGALAGGAPEMLARTAEGRVVAEGGGLVAVLEASEERIGGFVPGADTAGFLVRGALVAEAVVEAEADFLANGLEAVEAGVVGLRAGEPASGVLVGSASSVEVG